MSAASFKQKQQGGKKTQKFLLRFLVLSAFIIPIGAYAQESDVVIRTVGLILEAAILIFLVAGGGALLAGIGMFILNRRDEKGRARAKTVILWGSIGIAVMATAWGISSILTNYFVDPITEPGRREPPSYFPLYRP